MRAFVFSIDAFFAVLIASLLLSSIVMLQTRGEVGFYLLKHAQYAVLYAERSGALNQSFSLSDSAAQELFEQILNQTLPANVGGKLNVTICVGSIDSNGNHGMHGMHGGDGEVSFTCNRNIVAQKGTYKGDDRGVARRLFVDPENNKYGLAIMEVWYE